MNDNIFDEQRKVYRINYKLVERGVYCLNQISYLDRSILHMVETLDFLKGQNIKYENVKYNINVINKHFSANENKLMR